MTIVGGLRTRFVYDSLYNMIKDTLTDIGWFDSSRRHRPLSFPAVPVDRLTEIPLNTMVLADEGITELDAELGSNMVENRWTFYVDFYAEDEVIGKHLINDVKDLLAGRMMSYGRSDPSFTVYDYRHATPIAIATAQIERIMVDRAHDFPKPWQKFWYACRFDVVDTYMDDSTYSPSVPLPAEPDVIIDGGGP